MVLDLNTSELGTKEHWDAIYGRELQNFHECGDEGEIWFGRQCERRIVEWIEKKYPKDAKIVDFGSGNGHLLIVLAQHDFSNLCGIDYSEDAVKLASENAQACGYKTIIFKIGDILGFNNDHDQELANLVIDKGTFDAISLSSPGGYGKEAESRIVRLCSLFKASLSRVLINEGCFLITSCNWTRSELIELFDPEFRICGEIEHPSFCFGGRRGQTVTTLVFRKIKNNLL